MHWMMVEKPSGIETFLYILISCNFKKVRDIRFLFIYVDWELLCLNIFDLMYRIFAEIAVLL